MRPEDVLSEQFDVLIIDDLTSYMTRRLVQQAQATGKSVLGVFDEPEFPEGGDRLRSLGVDGVIDAHASPEEFLRAVGSIFVGVDRTVGGIPEGPAKGAREPEEQPPETGPITIVGGPSGGVGRTEIAIALAGTYRYRGESVALVDGDDLAPSIAQRLGLALHPNLRTAVDALQHRAGGLRGALSIPRHLGVEVLAGLANPRDWIELRSGDVIEAVRELADDRDRVIVDIAGRIEDLSFHGGPDRNGLARALVSAADVVIAVGIPSPVGVARLIEWLADAGPMLGGAAVHAVFNRVGKSSFQRREVVREFTRSFRPASLSFVPEDGRVFEAAWAGEAVPQGPFLKAVSTLVESVEDAQLLQDVGV
jgi:MinD-like ATPase involved in chromosome partitioning or flagellar assembly